MCEKCDLIKAGLDKYIVGANEDRTEIIIMDKDIPNLMVAANAFTGKAVVKIRLNDELEFSAPFGDDAKVKDEAATIQTTLAVGIDAEAAIELYIFADALIDGMDIERTIQWNNELDESFNSLEPMQSTMVH